MIADGWREVLAQPTRGRILALLRERRRALGTEELADALGLHPNGVRLHLERLRGAGLVTRERPTGGVGRPRDVWAVAPDAPVDPGPAYAQLSRWLTRALAAGARGPADVESVGRAIGRELAPSPSAPAAREQRVAQDRGPVAGAQLAVVLAAMGFAPREAAGPPGEWGCRLERCPYADAADDPEGLVCTLHRGITRGLVDVVAPDGALTVFRPQHPERAGCQIAVRFDA